MNRTVSRLLLLAFVLAVAGALRFHGLGAQLWLDEIDALTDSLRRPAASIVSQWPPGSFGVPASPHPLHDLLAHAAIVWLGESAFTVRLPAAVFGILGVAALFGLVESRLGRRAALFSSLLLAVSHPHVFQSQNARGYTALIFFATLATDLLLRLRPREGDKVAGRDALRLQALYAVAIALAAYSVPFGVFVLVGHVLTVAADAFLQRGRRSAAWPLRDVAIAAGAGVWLSGLLYAPLLRQLLGFAHRQSRLPTGAGVGPGLVYRLGVVGDALHGLAEAFGGSLGLTCAVLVAGAGAWLWLRRDAVSLALCTLPVLAQLLVLLVLDVPLSPRYFALALTPLIVSLGMGVAALASVIAARVTSRPAHLLLEAGVLAVAVATCAWPLAAYYRIPKQDFRGAIAAVDARAHPGDLRVAVHHAGRVLRGYYGVEFEDVRTVAELQRLEGTGKRILLVTTLERFLAVQNPALYEHVHESYRRLEELPATVRGAEMNLYERPGTGP